MFKFFHHQPPSVEQVVEQQLYEAKIDLLTAEAELESALARAEIFRNRVKRLTTQPNGFKESTNVARITK